MTHFAREYAGGLFELAVEENLTEVVCEQMEFLRTCFAAEPEYIQMLCARSLEPAVRKQLVQEAFGAQLHPYVLNFLKILTARGAMDHFEECARMYRQLYNEQNHIAEAQVTSAQALTPDQTEAIRQRLEEISGKKVVLHAQVDPKLIGGVQVDLEGRRYDNSIRTRLEHMRRTLIDSE